MPTMRRATMSRAVQTFIPVMPKGLTHNDLEAYILKRGGKMVAAIRKGNKLKHAEGVIFPYLAKARPTVPLEGPLHERIKLCYPLVAGKSDGDPYEGTPDYDNSIKVLNDLLQTLGYYANDAQVFDGHVTQYYASQPGIFVRLWELESWEIGGGGVM